MCVCCMCMFVVQYKRMAVAEYGNHKPINQSGADYVYIKFDAASALCALELSALLHA